MGRKLLLVQPVDVSVGKAAGWEGKGLPLVAVDAVGAGEGELVLLVQGSSARQTQVTEGHPVDCAIFAIVDSVERDGKLVFRKSEE